MRKRLWLQFHLWTIGLVVILSVANAAALLRPFAAHRKEDPQSLRRPASVQEGVRPVVGLDSRLALKTAQVSCEPKQRLKIVPAVRQIRLQFSICPGKGDAVLAIKNATNDFEATLFGVPSMVSKSADTPKGTFTPVDALLENKPRKPATESVSIASANVSTDYIALTPGDNEIKIRRSGREQILKIERR